MRISDWSSDVCSSDLQSISDLILRRRVSAVSKDAPHARITSSALASVALAVIALQAGLHHLKDHRHDPVDDCRGDEELENLEVSLAEHLGGLGELPHADHGDQRGVLQPEIGSAPSELPTLMRSTNAISC